MITAIAHLLEAAAAYITGLAGTRLVIPLIGGLIGFLLAALENYFSKRRRRLEADPNLRKLEAKKWNEHIKLFGSFTNTLGLAIVGAAFIIPYIKDHTLPGGEALWWGLGGFSICASGQFVIRFIQSES